MDPVRFARRLTVVAALSLLFAPALRAQSKTVWHHQFPAKIVDAHVFFSNGHLGVLTENGLFALAAEDGSEVWQVARACCIATQAFTHMGVVWQPDSVALVELDHGNRLWSLRRSLEIDTVAGVQFLPDRNLLVAWGFRDDSGLTVVGASLDGGQLLWRQDTLFRHVPHLKQNRKYLTMTEWQPVMLDTDSTIVAFPRLGGVMRLDSRTGELLWRVDTLAGTEPPAVPSGYARMGFDSTTGVVLVPFERQLMAVRDSDGKILWTRTAKFPSRLADIRVTTHGYLVRGYFKGDKPSEKVKPFVDLLDPATGQSRWPKPITDLDDASVMTVQGDTAWLASGRRLMAVALPGGEVSQRGKFEFKGDEMPAAIEQNDGSFILLSAHNLLSVTPSGEIRYQRHYPPPGSSLFSKIATGALLVGVGTLAVHSGYTPTYYPTDPKPVADPRYARALWAQRFVYILTGAKDSTGTKGFSVVRLDKTTGAEVGRVWVNDRSPDYRIDPVSGMLYLFTDDRTIEAMRF